MNVRLVVVDASEDLPKKPDVAPEQFFALDLRAGRVVSVESFPEARKPSHKITVDFGSAVGQRTTSAQTTHYSEEELVGRMVVAAINLGTKKIAGFKSEFLILGAIDPHGRVRLLRCEDGTLPGSPIA
jgi:tRNA-binding protein